MKLFAAHTTFGLIALFVFVLLSPISSYAQQDITSSGIAVAVPINGEVVDGDVICTSREGLKRCDSDYDQTMFGVVTGRPAAALQSDLTENAYLVVANGKARVRISANSSAITAGELVTTSGEPGLAMKADRNGYMLGTALDDFDSAASGGEGAILVSLNIHPSTAFTDDRSNLVEVLRQGLSAPLLTPLSALRYIMAGFVTIISFVLGFIYFGRLAKAAVDAIGRNPLAHKTIQLTVVFHIFVTVAVVMAGLGIAYMILAL